MILASASPRRRELLARAGVSFDVRESPLPEPAVRPASVSPRGWAEAVAYFKARAVADTAPESLVLGADTIVVCDGEVLGKPRDAADAERMLRLQAGRASDVVTGYSIIQLRRADSEKSASLWRVVGSALTRVFMRDDDAEIRSYLAGGEWAGKAGAYGIQDVGDRLIERIEGDFDNVVGLPTAPVLRAISVFRESVVGNC